jgi:hypothetical protein
MAASSASATSPLPEIPRSARRATIHRRRPSGVRDISQRPLPATTGRYLRGNRSQVCLSLGGGWNVPHDPHDVADDQQILVGYAPARSAPARFVLSRFAPSRSAPLRLAPLRSAPARSASLRLARLRSAFASSRPRRFWPARSMPLNGRGRSGSGEWAGEVGVGRGFIADEGEVGGAKKPVCSGVVDVLLCVNGSPGDDAAGDDGDQKWDGDVANPEGCVGSASDVGARCGIGRCFGVGGGRRGLGGGCCAPVGSACDVPGCAARTGGPWGWHAAILTEDRPGCDGQTARGRRTGDILRGYSAWARPASAVLLATR